MMNSLSRPPASGFERRSRIIVGIRTMGAAHASYASLRIHPHIKHTFVSPFTFLASPLGSRPQNFFSNGAAMGLELGGKLGRPSQVQPVTVGLSIDASLALFGASASSSSAPIGAGQGWIGGAA